MPPAGCAPGIAVVPGQAPGLAEAMREADLTLYREKAARLARAR